ncbi:hypothetical protein, partial [Empedobacter stercoris]
KTTKNTKDLILHSDQ